MKKRWYLASLRSAVFLLLFYCAERKNFCIFWKLGNPEISYSVGWEIEKSRFPTRVFFSQSRPFWENFFWILIKMGNRKNTFSHFLGKSGKSGKSTNQEKFQKRGSKVKTCWRNSFFNEKALVFSLASLGSLFTTFLLREAQKILHSLKSGKFGIGYRLGWEIEK